MLNGHQDDDRDPVYYRLYDAKTGGPTVVCMQWFDEFDYDENRFISETKYRDEDEANAALAAHVAATAPVTIQVTMQQVRAIAVEAGISVDDAQDRATRWGPWVTEAAAKFIADHMRAIVVTDTPAVVTTTVTYGPDR